MRIRHKNCKVCNKEIERIGQTAYCSKECKKKGYKIAVVKRGEKGNCLICNKEFIKNTSVVKFCSKECCFTFHNTETEKHRTVKYFEIFTRDNFKCVYCGKSSIEDGIKLVIDHVIPFLIEQKSVKENLITACNTCNLHKHSKTLPKEVTERIHKLIESRNTKLTEHEKTMLNELSLFLDRSRPKRP